MRTGTDHQSFILRPSEIIDGGVGVFALHDIQEGTALALFTENFQEELRKKSDVPEELEGYCLGHESGKILCPKYFNQLDIGNYINHSNNPNASYVDSAYIARRDIKAGTEILADYNELGEPEDEKDEYYFK